MCGWRINRISCFLLISKPFNVYVTDKYPSDDIDRIRNRSIPQGPDCGYNVNPNDSNRSDGKLPQMILSPSIEDHDQEQGMDSMTESDTSSTADVVDSISLGMLSDEKGIHNRRLSTFDNRRLSTFEDVVKAARAQSAVSNHRSGFDIPIITIDYTTERDIYGRQNREPKQDRYKDPKTGLPFLNARNKMHHLSVPKRGVKKVEVQMPGTLGVHPAFGKKTIKKALGVKRIQYLIDQRTIKQKKREDRRRKKARQKWIDANNERIAQEAAASHRDSTLAWT